MMFRRVEITIITLSFVLVPIAVCIGLYLYIKCRDKYSIRENVEIKGDSPPNYDDLFGKIPAKSSV